MNRSVSCMACGKSFSVGKWALGKRCRCKNKLNKPMPGVYRKKKGPFMKQVAAIVIGLVFACTAFADDYLYNGYTTGSGYIYRNGYFYNGNQAYTRTVAYNPGYWSCGAYYYGSSYYVYTPYYSAATYTPPAATVKDFDTQLFELATFVKSEESKVNKLNALGIKIPVNLAVTSLQVPVGYNGAYSTSGHIYQNTYPITNTSYSSSSLFYRDTDPLQMNLLVAQGIKQAGSLFGDMQAGLNANMREYNAGAAEAARIKATGDAAVAYIQSITKPAVAQSSVIQYQINPVAIPPAQQGTPQGQQGTGTGTTANPADMQGVVLNAWISSARTDRCVNCHLGANAKGGFNLEDYPSMSQAERAKRVYPRIDPAAAGRDMPRKTDNSVDVAMSAQNFQLWQAVKGPPAAQANQGPPVVAQPLIKPMPIVD
jgi:hypothetical protein